jgi:hypothetical protein
LPADEVGAGLGASTVGWVTAVTFAAGAGAVGGVGCASDPCSQALMIGPMISTAIANTESRSARISYS